MICTEDRAVRGQQVGDTAAASGLGGLGRCGRPDEAKGARYVRVVGISPGQCPGWHKGAGYPCWFFADEVRIE